MTSTIPQPPGLPFLGNVTALDKDLPIKSFELLAQQYGDIYQLNLIGRIVVFANSYELVNELSDESRFIKQPTGALFEVRNLVGDGLFTAFIDEPNWGVAHRLLMPVFGPATIRGMLEDMRDIAGQLVLKWKRFGPDHNLEPSEDFTKLALDTLALCSMSHRFNSFYTEHAPPFVSAMGDFLKECFPRANRPTIVQTFMTSATNKYEADRKLMTDLGTKIVADRKADPTEHNDLLDKMLKGKDPKTGQGMTDQSIINNLLTFLIAGHETTSGTLTFIMYYLLKNPEAMRKLRAEVDATIGTREAQYEDLTKMPYLVAVMRETLRLQPPASQRSVKSLKDTTIGGGKYFIKEGQAVVISNWLSQRDHAVFGEDSHEFKPERMLEDAFKALPPNAWQPFGNGVRACIGRPFAWQEIQLTLATLMQTFDFTQADPSYTLELKQTLTIKPAHFYIRARLRTTGSGGNPLQMNPPGKMSLPGITEQSAAGTIPAADATLPPCYVLYGSNTGTSEAFAQRVATDAVSQGFKASIGTLDSAAEHLPTDGPVIIVTASFEGEPADNAVHFIEWLKSLTGSELKGVKYAVFGCGNHDWVQTYQKIPKFVDDKISERGGVRLLERGVGDAAEGSFFEMFDTFEAKMWDALRKEYNVTSGKGAAPAFEVKTVDSGADRAATLRHPDASMGHVVENRVLSAPGAPIKRHIEFQLPEGMSSQAGDYLAILPTNPHRDVHRVLARFSLPEQQEVVVSSVGPTALPTNKPISLSTLLSGYVELAQPATTRDLATLLLSVSPNSPSHAAITAMSADYSAQVQAKRLSVLDILESHPDTKIELGTFLQMLPAMRVRQYSISSSPLWNPAHVTLTISVVEGPALSGKEEVFLGVSSNFLANLRAGDKVQMAVRQSSVHFHPPSDPMVPVVMFCSGSGIAPMRGFMQDRAMQKKAGREVGKMLLFFGCRNPKDDYLYSESDLKEWVELGFLDVRTAFSRSVADSEGCKYVQDRIWHDRSDIKSYYESGAKFFTCGSGKVATGIKEKLIDILQVGKASREEAISVFDRITKDRYVTDIFD